MRTPSKRLALFVLAGGVALAAGIGAFAHEPGTFAFHHQAMSSEDIASHVDKFLQHVYIEADATDAQKAQIEPLVKQAVADLLPMHDGARNFHQQALALLSQDTIDRAAIESMRAEHMQAADQASRRIAQVLGDVAEVLTPAQRKALAAKAAQMHGLN
jgi:Spy/CpxP family protein refolding chaperone